MVEDLHDSERKLTKLLEQYQNHGIFCEVNKLQELLLLLNYKSCIYIIFYACFFNLKFINHIL